jgi:hypothetical protein
MSASPERSLPRREGLLLAADAFVITAAFDVLLTVIVLGAVRLFRMPTSEGGVTEVLGSLAVFVPIIVGPLFVWRARGNRLGWGVAAAMVAGAIVGMAVTVPAMGGLGFLIQKVAGAGPDQPPALGVVALAFGVLPVIEAVRDLRAEPPARAGYDWLRIAAFALVVVLGGVVFPIVGAAMGDEAGEAGVFALLFGVAGAFAVTGANLLARLRKGPRPAEPTEQSAAAG